MPNFYKVLEFLNLKNLMMHISNQIQILIIIKNNLIKISLKLKKGILFIKSNISSLEPNKVFFQLIFTLLP